ncbi:MAG TPA: DNA-directed RNA polymerase subunit omega [Ruminococcaceae bacterium]|nr:DNA-directed RNA polymerase subunit omega [Oscillospiraceae bacterium]
MLNENLGKLIEDYDNRYRLVIDIARCARKVSKKAEAEGEILTKKPVSIAIDKLAKDRHLV